jgi:hypothetical protein
MPDRILIKTTIRPTDNDSHVGRFSLLARRLASARRHNGFSYEIAASDGAPTLAGEDIDLPAISIRSGRWQSM